MADGRWEELLGETRKQQQFLDMFTLDRTAAYQEKGGRIFCAKGCSSCCTLAVNCTLPEALLIATSLDELQAARVDAHVERLRLLLSGITELKEYLRLYRREMGGCPLLAEDGACGAYAVRPLSCRALLATRESHWCGIDFATLTPAEKQEFVAGLDRPATAFPMHYLATTQDAGRELEVQATMQSLRSCGLSMYGNMPVLVHLINSCGLLEAVAAGQPAVMAVTARAGLDNPLLLETGTL